MSIIKDLNEAEGYIFKHRFALFMSLLNILMVAVIASYIAGTGKLLQGDEKDRPQLSVSGEGKIFIKPDIAMFTVAVITDAARIGDAQNENSTRSNAVAAYLKQSGIQDKDLKTVSYSVEPQYQYDNGRPCPVISGTVIPCPFPMHNAPRIVSYKVRSLLEIKVRDLNRVDDLLQGVVSAGGNEIGSVVFNVDDEKAAMAEARKQAIEDAQQKAARLAEDLGVRLKKIVGFSETSGAPVFYSRSGMVSVETEAAPAPQVQPGEQEIRSNVTVTYEFR